METEEAPPSAEIMPDRETGYFDRRNSGARGIVSDRLSLETRSGGCGRDQLFTPVGEQVAELALACQLRVRMVAVWKILDVDSTS